MRSVRASRWTDCLKIATVQGNACKSAVRNEKAQKVATMMKEADASTLLEALDKVGKKRKADPTLNKIDELIATLEEWEASEDNTVSNLHERLSALDTRAVVAAHHKEVASLSTKLGKAADKALGPSVEGAVPPGQSLDPALVNQAVHQHLLVAGRDQQLRS